MSLEPNSMSGVPDEIDAKVRIMMIPQSQLLVCRAVRPETVRHAVLRKMCHPFSPAAVSSFSPHHFSTLLVCSMLLKLLPIES
jgi:hypothetical protein